MKSYQHHLTCTGAKAPLAALSALASFADLGTAVELLVLPGVVQPLAGESCSAFSCAWRLVAAGLLPAD